MALDANPESIASPVSPPKRRRSPLIKVLLALVFLAMAAVLGWMIWSYVSFSLPAPDRGIVADNSIRGSSIDSAQKEAMAVSDKGTEAPFYYAYSTLDEEDRERYDIILNALRSGSKRAFPIGDRAEIERIEGCVLADYPELSDYCALVICEGDLLAPAYVVGVPLLEEDERLSMAASIAAVRDQCLASLPEGDDYQKALAIYRWIADHCAYDHETLASENSIVINAKGIDEYTLEPGSSLPVEYGQTVSNVLLDREAVCAGYARTFQYLLQNAGIPCTYIEGSALGDSHGWCLAFLDGKYYLVDPTWGDPEYIAEEGAEIPQGTVDYRFFAVTDADMASTHVAQAPFPLPPCTATDDNYFVREGLYFDSPDGERLGMLVSAAAQAGTSVAIRCADRATFDELLRDWVESGAIGDYTPDGSYQYTFGDEGILTLEIWPSV